MSLKDRNISKSAGIAVSKIQGMGLSGPIVGNPRYVIKDAATAMSTWIRKRVKSEYVHATIDAAINAADADSGENRGDKIYVLPGHTETLSTASAITADVDGLEIIGVGHGADTPTLTFSATDATIVISGASVSLKNILLVPSIDSVASPIVVSGTNCTLDVEVRDASAAIECVRAVLTTAAADNLTAKVVYKGFTGGNACVNCIRLVGADNATIDVDFYGVASTAIVEFHTTACTNVSITGNFYNSGTTDLSKDVVDTATGSTWWVDGFDGAAGAEFSGGSGNAVAVGDLSTIAAGIVTIDGYHDVGTADATTNVVMSDVIGNKSDAAADGDVTSTESLVAYAKQNVGALRDNGRGGSYWYLDSGATAGGTGTSWTDAWDTLAEAIAGASSYDTILVKDGSTYDIGAAQNIGVTGLHIIGTGAKEQNFAKAMIYGGTGHFLTINAHEVWIDNISFVSPLNTYDAIRVATTASYFKIKITNCKFDLSNGEYCIKCDDTWDAPDLVIENNLFRSFSTGGIYLNTTRAQVRNNRFLILNAGTTAIEHVPTGGSRPDTIIVDNEIYGVNSTDIGIEITNTPTEALFHMSGNRVINCATPVTAQRYTSWYDGNYWGINDGDYHSSVGANGGRVHYVDANAGTTGLDGRSRKSAFLTLSEANAVATTRDDIIYMAPGDYDEAGVVNITTQGLQIIGEGPKSCYHNKAMIYSGAASHLMTINKHEVVIDNIHFSMPDDTKDAIRISTTAASYKVTIRNCRLDGWSGEYGIYTANDSPDLLIEDCLFRSWNTAAVYANSTRTMIRRCIFHVVTDKIGIEHIPAGGSRPDNVYVDNYFSGIANSSTTGIKFTGAPSNGTIMVMKNYFAGTWDTTITKIAAAGGVLNYVSDGSGGALIDTVT